MPGQIKRIIDTIIEQRAQGNATIVITTKTKLVLKGIDPDAYTAASPDDPEVIEKVRALAGDLNVSL